MVSAVGVEPVAEAAETVAEEALEVADAVRRITGRDISVFACGFVLGAAGGLTAGYFLLSKRLDGKYSKIMDEKLEAEMVKVRAYWNAKKVEAEDKPDLAAKVKELGYSNEEDRPIAYNRVTEKPKVEVVPPEPETKSVFDAPQPTQEEVEPSWDYAEEIKGRTDDVPFIIHKDEFSAGEMEYDTATLTYFEGDDVLINEQERVIEDQDEVLGLGNLTRWGHGSGDPNVLYIRNPVLGMDIEVVRSMGEFAKEVHGVPGDDELRHSHHRIRPHRRFDDDERT